MKNTLLFTASFSAFLFFSNSAKAEKMYGVFMVSKGSVKIQTTAGEAADAKVGSKVYEGDSVATGKDSRAKIVMSDRNVLNLSPDTQLKISKYQNDAASGTKNVEVNLSGGKVRTNVEQTYDGDKSKFLIKTPTAVAGVRGTQFLTGFNRTTQITSIVTFKGSVSLASMNKMGQIVGTPVLVKKGETTNAAPNALPEAPKALPKEEMKKLDKESVASSTPPSATTPDAGGTGKRDPASNSAEGSTSNPSSGSGASPSMIDKKDVDVSLAKDIKDVRSTTPSNIPNSNTPVPTDANSAIRDAVRGSAGKTRVSVKPQPTN